MAVPPSLSARDHFDRISSIYERLIGRPTREISQYLLTLTPPLGGDAVVLDNACGPGIVTEEILKLDSQRSDGRHQIKVYAVDMAPSMIASMKNKCSIKGWTNVECEVMNAQDLTFADGMFNQIFMNFGIFFLPDAEKGAAQIHRTLKPGGVAVVTSWAKLGFLLNFHEAQKRIRPDMPLFTVPWSDDWQSEWKLRHVLEAGGFKAQNIEIATKVTTALGRALEESADIFVHVFSRGYRWMV